jgi:hypothetical protein
MKCTLLYLVTLAYFPSTDTPFDVLNGSGWSNVFIRVRFINTHKSSKEELEAETSGLRKSSNTSNSSVLVSSFFLIVLSDKTTLLRVVFYCPQHKVQLGNDHAV